MNFSLSIRALSGCDVLVVSEPGDVARLGPQKEIVASPFLIHHTPRPSDPFRGGVAVFCKRATVGSIQIPLPLPPPGVDVQLCAVVISRDTVPICVVIGVYATCYRVDNVRDNNENTTPIFAAFDAALHVVSTAHPLLPVMWAGDFNARHTAFGDAETHVRGRLLYDWSLLRHLVVVGTPSSPSVNPKSALDLVLVPHELPVSAPSTRTIAGSDHLAVLVDIDYTPTFYYQNSLDLSGLNEEVFLTSLESSLHSFDGTPHTQDFRLSRALQLAIACAGGEWRRSRRYDTRRPATVEKILSAAYKSPWSAISLLRPPSVRISDAIAPNEMLKVFGSEGMQKHHTDAPLSRAPMTGPLSPFTPVEVASAISSLRADACPDSNGISAKLLQIAARSARFLMAFSNLMNTSLLRGVVSPRWTTSHITAIPKPNKPTTSAENLRPIYICEALRKLADVCMDRRRSFSFAPHESQLAYRKGISIDILPYAVISMARAAVDRSNPPPVPPQPTQQSQPLITRWFPRLSNSASQPTPAQSQPTPRPEPIFMMVTAVDSKNAFPATPARGIIDGYKLSGVTEDFLSYKTACLLNRRVRVVHRGESSRLDSIRDGTDQGAVTGPPDYSAFSSTLLRRLDVWKSDPALPGTRDFGMAADDLFLMVVGTIAQIRSATEAALKIIGDWAREYEVLISEKTCALVFSPQGNNQVTWPFGPLHCGPISFVPQRQGSIRVLGYNFDARLTMKDAVDAVKARLESSLHLMLPLMIASTMEQRKALYDALAYSHVRRITPLLLALVSDESSLWDSLDSAIAVGCRLITGAIATAKNAAVILEAGFLPSRALAIEESIRLRAKWGTLTGVSNTLLSSALDLLGRHSACRGSPTVCSGVVTDRSASNPAELGWSDSVVVRPSPTHPPDELAALRSLDPNEGQDAAEILRIKRLANDRVRTIVDRFARESCAVYCDGSVLRKSNTKPRAGGAGAAAVFIDGSPEYETFTLAGAQACSFSAETQALLAALRLIKHGLESGAIPRGASIPIVTDSQGLLAALAKGPINQTDLRTDAIWHSLLCLVREHGVVFGLFFAYGHTGWGEADHVDKLAGQVARIGADTDLRPWWKDAARTASDAQVHAVSLSLVAKSLRSRRGAPGGYPSSWPKSKFGTYTKKELVNLCQLRTNACVALGGYLANETTQCKHCQTQVRRSDGVLKSMVEHAFLCYRLRGARRLYRIHGVQDLWKRPREALDYITNAYLDEPREASQDPTRHLAHVPDPRAGIGFRSFRRRP